MWLFYYLEMDCDGSGHIVGFVKSQPNQICVIKIKDKPVDNLHSTLIFNKPFPYVKAAYLLKP